MVCFKYIKNNLYENTLSIGGAYGDELLPIINNIAKITIIDPSDSFSSTKEISNTPCTYVKPISNGDFPFEDNSFDLITAFGVFHHIPNVSHVLSEANRVLTKGGQMCLREPIVSMGNWANPRQGLK